MQVPDVNETIVAIASAAGPGLRGIVRISGPQSLDVACALFRLADPIGRQSCRAYAASFVPFDDERELELPGQLFVWPQRRSFTRQPTVEFHTQNCRPLLKLLLSAACRQGARLAQPGEFTLRAFLSGRIDLTQAEAVLAVIDAAGPKQLERALAQLAGGLATPLANLRESLLELVCELEAGLDFVEEDIEFISTEEIRSRLQAAVGKLRQIVAQLSSRGSSDDLPVVALVGEPNAGKSSLFNALQQRSAAIVSGTRGTTRDTLTAILETTAGAVNLVDTAGVDEDEPVSEIDRAAREHARRMAGQADLVVRLMPKAENDQQVAPAPNEILVWSKADLLAREATQPESTSGDRAALRVSSRTGEGIETLREQIGNRAAERQATDSPVVPTTALRTGECLRRACVNLEQALQAAEHELGLELVASETRQALAELAEVVGEVYTDDILDRIFSRFCIGK